MPRRWALIVVPPSTVEPGGGQAAADVVAEVRAIVLQRAVPHGGGQPGGEGDIVLLPGEVALDLVDHLAPLADVERAPLADDEVGDHGVVDAALVPRLTRHVLTVEIAVGLEERRLGAE